MYNGRECIRAVQPKRSGKVPAWKASCHSSKVSTFERVRGGSCTSGLLGDELASAGAVGLGKKEHGAGRDHGICKGGAVFVLDNLREVGRDDFGKGHF